VYATTPNRTTISRFVATYKKITLFQALKIKQIDKVLQKNFTNSFFVVIWKIIFACCKNVVFGQNCKKYQTSSLPTAEALIFVF